MSVSFVLMTPFEALYRSTDLNAVCVVQYCGIFHFEYWGRCLSLMTHSHTPPRVHVPTRSRRDQSYFLTGRFSFRLVFHALVRVHGFKISSRLVTGYKRRHRGVVVQLHVTARIVIADTCSY